MVPTKGEYTYPQPYKPFFLLWPGVFVCMTMVIMDRFIICIFQLHSNFEYCVKLKFIILEVIRLKRSR